MIRTTSATRDLAQRARRPKMALAYRRAVQSIAARSLSAQGSSSERCRCGRRASAARGGPPATDEAALAFPVPSTAPRGHAHRPRRHFPIGRVAGHPQPVPAPLAEIGAG